MNILKKLFSSVPHKFCVACGRKLIDSEFFISDTTAGLCHECSSKIRFTKYGSSFDAREPLKYMLSPIEYGGMAVNILRSFKFRSSFKNGDIINLILKDFLSHYPHLSEFDIVIPVPLSKQRLRERGFNQSEILARSVSKCINVPLDTKTLTRPKNTMRQSSFAAYERFKNVADAFKAERAVTGKHIILVDDIYTTGSTMSSCASELKKAGAASVIGITAAIVMHTPHKPPLRPVTKPLLKCRSFNQIKNHFKYKTH